MTDIPKTIYGVAIALFRGNEVYLSQRMWNQLRYANNWQIIYGFVKGDYERYADAAVRIVRVETGINLTINRLCFIKSMMVGNEFYYTYFVHLKDDEVPAPADKEQFAIRGNFISFPLQRAIYMNLVPCLEKVLKTALRTMPKTIVETPGATQSLVNRADEMTTWSCMCDYD